MSLIASLRVWCWGWSSNPLATWYEELTHWKRPWCWERLKSGGEGDNRGWNGWMASLIQWTWVWVNSGSWWWTGRPGVLQSMGLQRVGHDWVTELNWEVTEEDPEMLRWLSLHLTFFFLFPQLIYWNYFLHWRKDWRWWQPAAGRWWETSLGSRILCGTEGFTQRFHLLPLRIINVHLISRLEACI